MEGDELLAEKYQAMGFDVAAERAHIQRDLGAELDVFIAQHRRRTIQQLWADTITKVKAKLKLVIALII